ncbi:nudix hydrolase 18, mitochondrial-like [Macadamia integrifolia]|uniref:nudix hydrolase 18, mitochondrial-like n=1 Tax=Macadamia integrifolia TaxID=60698 RepID=UPI001C4E6D58|nr:nudix hydrolase 18, mitochondrial-like [Macadamia integrifolia]
MFILCYLKAQTAVLIQEIHTPQATLHLSLSLSPPLFASDVPRIGSSYLGFVSVLFLFRRLLLSFQDYSKQRVFVFLLNHKERVSRYLLVSCSFLATLVCKSSKMVSLVSRTGRNLQRYREGRRIVVGCVPYRYKNGKHPSCESTNTIDDEGELEILVISSQKGHGMLFPKGGWESDESIEDAAERETEEEAGVRGEVQRKLGEWPFKSRRYNTFYEGVMFPLLVKEQLDQWPEKNHRRRMWMTVAEAREVCQHHWMKEALDRLVKRLMQQPDEEDIVRSPSSSSDEETISEEEIAPCVLL